MRKGRGHICKSEGWLGGSRPREPEANGGNKKVRAIKDEFGFNLVAQTSIKGPRSEKGLWELSKKRPGSGLYGEKYKTPGNQRIDNPNFSSTVTMDSRLRGRRRRKSI